MNRRSAVKNLLVSAGTVITFPSWVLSAGFADQPVYNTSYTPQEQAILASVCDTIIPAGNAVGALSVGVDKYLQKLFDDCYEPAINEEVKNQLIALQSSSKMASGKLFTELNPSE